MSQRVEKSELARQLATRFDPAGLRALLRRLGVNPADVHMNPETREELAWAILEYFDGRGRRQELEAEVERAQTTSKVGARAGRKTDRWRRLGVASACAVLVAVAAIAAVRWEAPPRPFPEDSEGVLVGLQSASDDAGTAYEALCSALTKENSSLVRCVRGPLLDDPARRDDYARTLGASLVVSVDANRRAHIVPMKVLADHALLSEAIPWIDVSTESAAKELAPVLLQLAAIASKHFNANTAACLDIPSNSASPLALLIVYTRQFSLGCVPDRAELDVLKVATRCGAADTHQKSQCSLARYLFSERCPECSETPRYLNELRDAQDSKYRTMATLKFARSYCESPDEASASVDQLLSLLKDDLLPQKDPCMRAMLTWVAACTLRAAAPSGALDRSPETRALKHELETLSAWSPEQYAGCAYNELRATALEWRAYGYSRTNEWDNAAKFYKEANELYSQPERLLGLVEAWIHLGKPEEASRMLRNDTFRGMCAKRTSPDTSGMNPALLGQIQASIRYALLGWIASNQLRAAERDDYADCLTKKHDEIPDGEPALSSEDAGLKELLRDATGSDRVYEILRGDSSAHRRQELRRLVGPKL